MAPDKIRRIWPPDHWPFPALSRDIETYQGDVILVKKNSSVGASFTGKNLFDQGA